MTKPLDCMMDNVLAWRLGEVALACINYDPTKIGDLIDRGLILRRLLDEAGFELRVKEP